MAGIREELTLADKFSQTFKNFDAAANASINVAQEFQRALFEFSEGYLDGLIEGLQESRDELSGMNDDINKAASSEQNFKNEIKNAERELKNAENSQNDFSKAVENTEKKASSLVGTLGKIAGVIGAANLVKNFVETSDEMSQMTAKLNLINDGTRTTAELQNAIFESAQRSRGSYLDTANLVARLGMNAKDAFSSNKEMLQFAENLNKSFKIAGASAQEQASVILQMSQALASGVLRGQEFNAVMSGAPNVMRNVAEYMGVSVGALRDMAAEGEITASVVKDALLSATDSINYQFEQIPITFGDVMTTAKNKITMSLNGAFEEWITRLNGGEVQGAIDKVTSAVEKFALVGASALGGVATALLWVVDNFEAIEPVLIGAGAAVLTYKALHITAAEEVATKWAAVNTTISGIAVAVGALGFVATKVQQSIDKSEPVKAARESGLVESVGGYKGALEASLWLDELTGGLLSDAGKEIAASAFDLTHEYGGRGFNGTRRRAPGETAEERAARESATADWYNTYYGSRYTPNDEGFAEVVRASRDQNALYKMWVQENLERHDEEARRAKALEEIKENGVKVINEVKLSDEDLRIFRDIAENKYVANVELQTLSPQIQVNVENAASYEPEDLANILVSRIEEELAERTAIAH